MGWAPEAFTVVIAVDASLSSLDAFHKAMTLFSRRPLTTFHIVSVRPADDAHRVEKLLPLGLQHLWTRPSLLPASCQPADESSILSTFEKLAMDEGVVYRLVALTGSRSKALKEYSQAVNADLLVVGSLKRPGRGAPQRPTFVWCHTKGALAKLRLKG